MENPPPIVSAEVLETELATLDKLLANVDTSAWAVGDALIKLSGNPYNMELRQIAKRYLHEVEIVNEDGEPETRMEPISGRSYSRLSELRTLSQTVKPEDRNPNIAHFQYATVIKAAKTIERNAKKELGADYKVDIQKEIAEISQRGPARGSSRQVAVAMAAKSREALMPLRFANAEKAIANAPKEKVNNCHLGDYVEILKEMPPVSIKVLYMDPPYFGYKHDQLEFSSSSSNTFSANQDSDGAKATTLAAFELAATRLMRNGVILLWQVGSYLHEDIIAECKKHGFRIGYPIIWDKISPQPGDQVSPVSVSTEFCWPIFREGDQLWNVHNMKRCQVYYANPKMAEITGTNPWPRVRQSAYSLIEKHNFEKPMQSNVDLLELFSVENELIFETHGCTGGMSVACIQKKRNWVFCEMMEANFKLGFTRIEKALAGDFEISKPEEEAAAEAA